MAKAIDLISSTFSTDTSKKYRLSIRENSGGFSFSVLDLQENVCVAIKYLPCHTNLKDLKSIDLLQLNYQEILYFADSPFALVGTSLKSEMLPLFLPVETHKQQRAKIATSVLKDDSIQLIYDTHRYNKVDISQVDSHPLVPLIRISQQKVQQNMCIELQDSSLYIVVCDAYKVYFANVFFIDTAQDIAYFVMSTFQKLALSPDTVLLTLYGVFSDEMDPQPYLSKYVRQILKPTISKKWNAEFPDSLYSHFASLIE